MIELVCTPLPVRIAQQGCHGNHAFSQSPNDLRLGTFFLIQAGPGNFGTNENLSWGAM